MNNRWQEMFLETRFVVAGLIQIQTALRTSLAGGSAPLTAANAMERERTLEAYHRGSSPDPQLCPAV